MAATKQPGFRAGAAAASVLDDKSAPTSGAERIDTILAKRKLSIRSKSTQPKTSTAAAQKSFASGKAPTTKSGPYVKKMGR